MQFKELVPGSGEKSTRKRIKELEEKAGTLPVIFSLFFSEGLKTAVLAIPFLERFPELWATTVQMFLVSFMVGAIYVYQIDPTTLGPNE